MHGRRWPWAVTIQPRKLNYRQHSVRVRSSGLCTSIKDCKWRALAKFSSVGGGTSTHRRFSVATTTVGTCPLLPLVMTSTRCDVLDVLVKAEVQWRRMCGIIKGNVFGWPDGCQSGMVLRTAEGTPVTRAPRPWLKSGVQHAR